MKIGIIIGSNDPETVWNALRFGVFSLKKEDEVRIFLIGRGVEIETLDTDRFHITEQMKALIAAGGTIQACGTCLKLRQLAGSETCPLSTMQDMHDIVSNCDRLLTF